ERCSYFGLVTLALVGVALVRRAPVPRRRFWWALLACFVVLSFGGKLHWGALSYDLPSQWLYDWCPPFRQLRVPARFNLFAGVALHAGQTYWQALHRLRTSAGYSGFTNARYEAPLHEPSPFSATHLRDVGDWGAPAAVDVVKEADPAAVAWLFLRVHGFGHVV